LVRVLLHGALLGLGLVANSEYGGSVGWRSSRQRLAVVEWRHVGGCRVWAGVVGSGGGFCEVGVAVAACRSHER